MKYERLVPHPDALLTELSDGTGVLLHLETKFYFTLNATGVFVWKHFVSAAGEAGGVGSAAAVGDTRSTASSTDAAAQALTEAFDVETCVAQTDVRALVDELLEERLLRADA